MMKTIFYSGVILSFFFIWAMESQNKKEANRIEENADLFDFELSTEEMRIIKQLDRNQRIGPDPRKFPANWD